MTTPRSTALAPVSAESESPALPERSGDILSSPAAFKHALSLSQMLAKSSMLPQAFRGKPEDVFMAIMLAQRMGEDVFTVLANVHFVNGKPGWGAPFLIARANASGLFTGPLEFEVTGKGESLAVTCSAASRATGKRLSKTVSLAMAKADGWTSNRKYASLPEQMLSYRAATFFIRLHCPSVLYGFRPVDEIEDVEAARGHRVETSYEEPPHASLPRSSARPDPGARAAVHAHGGGGVRPSTSEAAPALALSGSASPPVALVVPESATFTAVPSGEDAGEPRADEAGSTPRARATSSLSAQAPGEGDSGSPAGPVSDGNPSPAPSHVEASQGHAPAAQGAGPESPRRITRAKLAERQAAARRRRETDEQKAARKAGHDSTWEDAREGFAADLRKIASDMSIDAVSAWCESIGKPTPSRRTPQDRGQLLKALREGKAGQLFLAWADELVDVPQAESAAQKEREAQAEEEGAPVAVEAFSSAEAAIAWGMDKGAFASIEQAQEAYETAKREGQPANAAEMAAMWVAEVQHRLQAREVSS
jgi:hypothetical protein